MSYLASSNSIILEREIVFGRHPVEELLRTNKDIEKIFMLQSAKGPFEIEIRKMCAEKTIPLIKTQNESLNKLVSGRNHQGIVAITSAIPFAELEHIIPHLYENGANPLIMILDHITDVRNLGAIARSAEIFGAHAIVIPKKGSASINEDAIKTSAGALFKIPVCRYSNMEEVVDILHNYGIKAVAADEKAEKGINEFNFSEPIAVIMGSEGNGVQTSLLKKCDEILKIPQVGNTDSLNVAVSAGIILYEIQNQRTSE